jgi:hypothetical protein
MPESTLRTPVVLAIFNRPETTARVFEQIRGARPQRLLVIADGPRPGREYEARSCREARAVVESVDWPCQVSTNYSDHNLGCRVRLSSGIDWAFDLVEEAIVLEDDCVPHSSFFGYCEELLERYRRDERVMHISGDNFDSLSRNSGRLTRLHDSLRDRLAASYTFTRYPHVWGWATWRRAWARYDVDMMAWLSPDVRGAVLDSFTDPSERSFWQSTWDEVSRGEIDTWDYQWAFACISSGGLSAMPRRNLVSNIGFGGAAARTTDSGHQLANLPVEGTRLPLRHPRAVSADEAADAHSARLFFGRSPAS